VEYKLLTIQPLEQDESELAKSDVRRKPWSKLQPFLTALGDPGIVYTDLYTQAEPYANH
jgi:hypothetical protein